MDAIRAERRQKTTILIAHRISALQYADEIIVLDEGRIVQRGTHQSLLAEEGSMPCSMPFRRREASMRNANRDMQEKPKAKPKYNSAFRSLTTRSRISEPSILSFF